MKRYERLPTLNFGKLIRSTTNCFSFNLIRENEIPRCLQHVFDRRRPYGFYSSENVAISSELPRASSQPFKPSTCLYLHIHYSLLCSILDICFYASRFTHFRFRYCFPIARICCWFCHVFFLIGNPCINTVCHRRLAQQKKNITRNLLPATFFLLLSAQTLMLQHILYKNPIPFWGVLHKHMGDRPNDFPVLDNGASAHPLHNPTCKA